MSTNKVRLKDAEDLKGGRRLWRMEWPLARDCLRPRVVHVQQGDKQLLDVLAILFTCILIHYSR